MYLGNINENPNLFQLMIEMLHQVVDNSVKQNIIDNLLYQNEIYKVLSAVNMLSTQQSFPEIKLNVGTTHLNNINEFKAHSNASNNILEIANLNFSIVRQNKGIKNLLDPLPINIKCKLNEDENNLIINKNKKNENKKVRNSNMRMYYENFLNFPENKNFDLLSEEKNIINNTCEKIEKHDEKGNSGNVERKENELSKNIILNSNEKFFRCSMTNCEKVFAKENILNAHMRTHTGEKPYKCNFENCYKSFSQYGNSKKHEKVHLGDKKFVCDFPDCLKRFSASYNLKVIII